MGALVDFEMQRNLHFIFTVLESFCTGKSHDNLKSLLLWGEYTTGEQG
jgi:hypothetical protein